MQWEFSVAKRSVVDCCVGEFDMISLAGSHTTTDPEPSRVQSGEIENIWDTLEDTNLTVLFHKTITFNSYCLSDNIIYTSWHCLVLFHIDIYSIEFPSSLFLPISQTVRQHRRHIKTVQSVVSCQVSDFTDSQWDRIFISTWWWWGSQSIHPWWLLLQKVFKSFLLLKLY